VIRIYLEANPPRDPLQGNEEWHGKKGRRDGGRERFWGIRTTGPRPTYLEGARRAEGRQLRHSPGVQHVHAVALDEGPQHGRRAGSASHDSAFHGLEPVFVVLAHIVQEAKPHRGDAGGDRDLR